MKKVVIFCGVIVVFLLTLAGCGIKKSKVKIMPKEADVASINHIENTNENNPENTEENKVYYVEYNEVYADNGKIIIVHGYGKTKSIWEYRTAVDIGEVQYDSVSFLKHDLNYGIVLIREYGVIKALDAQTGKEKWRINDFEGYCENCEIDSFGNIYVYTYFPNRLYIIDLNGKLTKVLDIYKLEGWEEDRDLLSPGDCQISFEGQGIVTIISNEIDYSEYKGSEEDPKYITRKLTIDTVNETIKVEDLKEEDI